MQTRYRIHGIMHWIGKMKDEIIRHIIVGLSFLLFCISFYISRCLPDEALYLMAWVSFILFVWTTCIYKIYLYSLFAAVVVLLVPTYTGLHVFWKYTDPSNVQYSERFNADSKSGTIVFFKDESVILFLDDGQCLSKYKIAKPYCRYYKKELGIK